MALLSDLVNLCAEKGVDTASTLNLFGRRLREAGRLSQKGRGRGAAHMTFLDAARFLIATAATDHPERAVDAEDVFSNLVLVTGGNSGDPFSIGADTLDQALAQALAHLSSGKVREHYDAEFEAKTGVRARATFVHLFVQRSGAVASLRMGDSTYTFYHPALKALVEPSDSAERQVRNEAFERETKRFRTAKNIVAEYQLGLLEAVAALIEGNQK